MKKFLIGLGLAAMLSSCVSTGLITVYSSDVDFTSNYRENDANGDFSRYAICEDRNDTEVKLSFSFEGQRNDFKSFDVLLYGTNGNSGRPDYRSPTPFRLDGSDARVIVNNNRVTVTFLFQAGTVPWKSPPVSAQAVVVNPVNPPAATATRRGSLDLKLSIRDRTDTTASSNFLTTAIPVWTCQ